MNDRAKRAAEQWGKFIDCVFYYIKVVVGIICWTLYSIFKPFHRNLEPTVGKIVDYINGRKTYIVSVTGIVSLLIAYKAGLVDLSNVITNVPILILAMTFRHGMARQAVPKIEGGNKEEEKSSATLKE